MSVLVDTTVLLAAAVEAHVHHEPSIDWLTTTISDTDLFVSAHSLAESHPLTCGILAGSGPQNTSSILSIGAKR